MGFGLEMGTIEYLRLQLMPCQERRLGAHLYFGLGSALNGPNFNCGAAQASAYTLWTVTPPRISPHHNLVVLNAIYTFPIST
jgi:hypothetical protein